MKNEYNNKYVKYIELLQILDCIKRLKQINNVQINCTTKPIEKSGSHTTPILDFPSSKESNDGDTKMSTSITIKDIESGNKLLEHVAKGNSDRTILESSATVIENSSSITSQTIIENNATVLDTNQDNYTDFNIHAMESTNTLGTITAFRGMRVQKQLKTQGSEADIYLVDDGGEDRIVKLYRMGLNPKQEVLDGYRRISSDCPEHVVVVHDTGFDEQSQRWFELLEFIKYGSLDDAFANKWYKSFDFKELVREITTALIAIHEHDMIHRDIKPGNILIRSFNPLDLVFTDFGIASILDAGASVRETIHGGLTPMYAAPEDILGKIVSRPADWWACGMIFLEVLTGVHPFKGLTANRISYVLATKGVPIDEQLGEREQMLVKGLLTRDDKKRWSGREVMEWLDGKDDIPVYYEGDAGQQTQVQQNMQNAFVFLGQPYSTLHDLAVAFASSYESWQSARGMLARGNVAKWLQDCHLFDDERIVSEDLEAEDPDEYVFNFVNYYAKELPVSLYGLEINAKNLLFWLQKKEDDLTEAEKSLKNNLQNGKFKKFINILKNKNIEYDEVFDWASSIQFSNEHAMTVALQALMYPDRFYWGTCSYPSDKKERFYLAFNLANVIVYKDIWKQEGNDELVIPQSIDSIFNDGKYEKAMREFLLRKHKSHLLHKKDLKESQYSRNNVFIGDDTEYDSLVRILNLGIVEDVSKNIDNINLLYKEYYDLFKDIKLNKQNNKFKPSLDGLKKLIDKIDSGNLKLSGEQWKQLIKIFPVVNNIYSGTKDRFKTSTQIILHILVFLTYLLAGGTICYLVNTKILAYPVLPWWESFLYGVCLVDGILLVLKDKSIMWQINYEAEKFVKIYENFVKIL